jgi:hypothetical protein
MCTLKLTVTQGKCTLMMNSHRRRSSQVFALRKYTVLNSAQDVSIILEILKANDCRFAVKSGGHTSLREHGASNIARAVTIDLRNLSNLNRIVVLEDQTQVSVGSELVWSQVYMELDALNMSVIGGRVSLIGV